MNIKNFGSKKKGVIFLFAAYLYSGIATAVPQQTIKIRFNKFYNVETSTRNMLYEKKAQLISDSYKMQFSGKNAPPRLDKLQNNDLKMLFYASDIASFYTFDPKFLNKMKYYFSELVRRKIAPAKYYYDIYSSLVASRDFDGAKIFSKSHPKIKFHSLPKVIDEVNGSKNDPTAFIFSDNTQTLVRKPIPIKNGPKIVMVAHPYCHYSRNAVKAISSNPILKKIFIHNAILLAPVDRGVDFNIFWLWNKRHPSMKMDLAYKRSEWPMFDSWETPTFYFMKDGSVVDKVIGWPDDGQLKALLKASRDIGVYKETK